MANVWTRATLLLVVLLFSVTPARGQPVPAPGGPVFAGEPTPPMGPEFCPPSDPAPVETAWPFQRFTPHFLNGFDEACPQPDFPIVYWGIGTLGLQRQGLGNGVIAVVQPGLGIDTGAFPAPDAEVAVRFGSVPEEFHWGLQARWGVQWGPHTIEAFGFYIPEQTNIHEFQSRGQIAVAFGANRLPPFGFGGNNFLWLQADRVHVILNSQLVNGEINYRLNWMPGFEWIAGFRYFDRAETFSIYTDDDGLTLFPIFDPKRAATYQIEANNRIGGVQFGFALENYLVPGVSVGLTNKYLVGANFYEVENRLIREDGFERPRGRRDAVQVGGLIELNFFLHIMFNDHIRLRTGYQTLFLWHVVNAHQQVDFDPANILGNEENNGGTFYHGPKIEFQLAF